MPTPQVRHVVARFTLRLNRHGHFQRKADVATAAVALKALDVSRNTVRKYL